MTRERVRRVWRTVLAAFPRGYALDEADWQRRHRVVLWVLAVHVPGLAVFGLVVGHQARTVGLAVAAPAVCIGLGLLMRGHRRTASVIVTAGMVWCSAALVVLSYGSIEAHFHFFVIIGFIALYQDWAPFLTNILFTVTSHGVGSAWQQDLIFGTSAGAENPWVWSLVHGVAVLFACVGMMLFWRLTEDSQQEKDALSRRLAEAEIGRQKFASDLLTNLARRNQSLLYRQLDIIDQLEKAEQDPVVLAEILALDHLATRVRRNAENLLVLSGGQPPRVSGEPVALRDVVRAAIAETEDLDRVRFVVDERATVTGHAVTDLTHLIAELTENAARFSPPDTAVTIRARDLAGGCEITVEDRGIGMDAAAVTVANALLADPPEVDLSVSQRLGFHVVARLAARHGVQVSLSATPGSGMTAVAVLPAALFAKPGSAPVHPPATGADARHREPPPGQGGPGAVTPAHGHRIEVPFGVAGDTRWAGWWAPDPDIDATAPGRALPQQSADPATATEALTVIAVHRRGHSGGDPARDGSATH
jgi:signal transduction histidine kinase